ncbi:dihydroorotate oxidase [Ornithobacterium rhinotracheale]|uniref:Dihydroorotate dehydrogenase n=1 Tax=Ornithobacterium rhinotracheale (strain ATCC 51463 / DSM 15997 / CCUG 23171 / CIP 104009 / LMG 9086) TaxID=867902 RepID=I3ZYV2_ORNRL|nr:dihydroorotate oxidase [Ornithobacterium rhinotracheale]AFL96886.1 dihydroorotate dehydrogenase family protein [Ornithobacterium rhinotracheale DSM 15997]AIP99053.1 dihydroorotate dehydrogenase [Ornithobacterium rhinotracheale ORT-UMN 88]KGB66972.1 dihydroorotate dehydrogenase [Ornithobacterium rhinotracheale H06-030791]MBN3662036.1 dihydroorotate oxidase [Ornithobacterium rhinotracheale]MCK0194585.1 dihydroorotate oxidase [Ornithobacterium rhinotracheale]
MDLSTHFAQHQFSNCLMNASGAKCMELDELENLLQSASGAMVTKSTTPAAREGNPSPRYVDLELGSINSMGLPNNGLDFYLDFCLKNEKTKPIFLSLAGICLEDNLAMLQRLQETDGDFIVELNLSCPNIPGKPQTGYDFERTQEVLEKVFAFYTKPLGVKLPPYFDMVHFEQMAAILNQFPLDFVTCINSIGNGLFIDTDSESVVIKPKEGFGGLGGAYVKPTALANVRKFYQLLKPEIAVIGCGGVESGKDVFEHILCGAAMVQVGTQLMKEGTPVFDRLLRELQDIMQAKGYNSISEFKGNLKSL